MRRWQRDLFAAAVGAPAPQPVAFEIGVQLTLVADDANLVLVRSA